MDGLHKLYSKTPSVLVRKSNRGGVHPPDADICEERRAEGVTGLPFDLVTPR